MSEQKIELLSLKQQDAITALLREPSMAKAANVAGVTERTLYRWLSEPLFASVYREGRRKAFGQAIAQCQYYSTLAVNTLARLVADTGTPAHARVAAALGMLKFGREGIELEDLAARIETLENLQRGESGQPAPLPPNPWSPDDGDEPDETGGAESSGGMAA